MEDQIRNYQKILKANPTDVPAFTALEEIYTGTDGWRELVLLYDERIQHLGDPDLEVGLLEKCAGVWHHKIADSNKTLAVYENIRRIQPDNRVALEGLEDVYSQRNEWKKLADVLEMLALQTGDAVSRADLYRRLGALYLERLNRRDRALVAWKHAFKADPKRTDVLASMRAVFSRLGYFRKVKELLDNEAVMGAGPPTELGEKYLQLGVQLLAEPLFDAECQEALDKAKTLLSDPAPAEEALKACEEAKADWEERVKKLRVDAVESPDKASAVGLYRQIAEIYFLQGGHDEQVEDNLNKCALLQPGNVRVLRFTERYYLDRKRPKELLDRFEEMLAKARDRVTMAVILERIAVLASVHLQDRKASAEAYRRILEKDPGQEGAVASLVEHYQEEGQWAEVVELLRSLVDQRVDPKERADVLLQIARITSEHLKDPEGARFLYEEVLRLDDHNLSAATALVKPYDKASEHNGLVRCLEIQLHHARVKKERAKLLDRIMEIHREKRGDPVEAFHVSLRSLSNDPGKKKVLKAVIELGEETGRYQEFATALRSAMDSGNLKGKSLLEVMENLAGIYETKLADTTEAIKIYQRMLDQDEKSMSALDALERLQVASGGSVELVGIYRQQLDLVRSKEKKKELLFKLVSIYRDRMADFGQAIVACQQILDIDEYDGLAWSHLADLHEREGHWEEAAQALEQSIALIGDLAQKLRVQCRLAHIYEQRLNDTEKSLALCNRILASDQVDPELAAGTVSILERLQGRGVSPLRIAEILQPYYALAGDWRRHIDMLEFRLEGCSSAEDRVQLLGRIAQVYEEELQQSELAFSAYGRAFGYAPEQANLREKLVRLAEQTGHVEELAGFLEEALLRTEDRRLLISLHLDLGELYGKQLNRPRQAITAFGHVLEFEEENSQAQAALVELFRATGDWEELAGALGVRLKFVAEEKAQVDLLLELAQVTEEELHDRPKAIEILRQVHDLVGDDLTVLRRLDVLLEKEGRWPDLAGILKKEIPLVSQEEASELNLRLGRVCAERMEEREHAVEHYRQVLSERPDDARAVEALESLLGRPDSAGMAAEILQPIYENQQDWSRLVRVLEIRAETLSDPREKVDVLQRVAEIYDQKLSQKDRAFAALRRAFRNDSNREDVLGYMERLAEQSASYDEMTAALEDAVSSQENPERQVFLLHMLAGLYRDRLRRPDLAATGLRRLLEIEPTHAAALSSLEALYRDSQSLQDLAWVLSRQAEGVKDPEKKRDLLVQVAQIREEQLGDLEGAVEAYRQVFLAHPEDIHAAKQLDRLFQLTNRWEDEVELLPKLAELSKNILGVIDYNRRLAGIYADNLNDPRRAIQIYKHILQIKSNHPETVASIESLLKDENCRLAAAEVLEGVYRSISDWRKLTAILEMLLAASADADKRMGYFAQLRDLYENRINERALAFNVASRAFKEQPHDEGVQQDLLRLSEGGDFFEELVATYLDVSDHHVGTDLAVDLRKRVAGINEKHLDNRVEAIEQWERLMESHGHDAEVLSALERLYREDGNFAALVLVYRTQVDLTEDMGQKKDLLFRTAACLTEGVEDLDGGIAVYREILDLDPDDRRAYKLLDGLFATSERWSDLAVVLQREIELSPAEPTEEAEAGIRQDLLLRMADVQLTKLENPEVGMAALQEFLQRNRQDPRATAILEQMLPGEHSRLQAAELLDPIYRTQGDFKKLVAIMEVRLAGREEAQERLQIYRELMQIYEEELTQKPLAFMVACRAFRENFDDEGIRKDLEQLAEQTGSFEELAGVYEEVLTKTEETETRPAIERRLAQLKEAYLEDKDEAVAHWRHVLSSDPDDMETLKALERLYRERGAYSELVGILRHMAELAQNADQKKDLYHEVATLMEERLGRNDGAIDAYLEILSDDPQDVAVLKLLDRLLEKESRWEDLQEILLREIEKAADSEMIPLQLRLANVLRVHRSSPDEAVSRYAAILEGVPGQPDAVQALVEMFDAGEAKDSVARILVDYLDALEDWRHLIGALDVIYEASEHASERKNVLIRMAAIYEGKLDQKELAFTTLGRAFSEDPADENLRLSLERLAAETDSYEILAAIYVRALDDLDDRAVLLMLRRRLASLFEERLGDPEQALDNLQAVVDLDPKDSVNLVALERIYRQDERYDDLVEILRKRTKLTESVDEATALLYEIAGIHDAKLSDPGGAIQAYREVLEHQPEDLNALRLLDQLCVKQGRMKDLAEVLTAEINLLDKSGECADALDLRFRLAHLYESEYGDHQRAGTLYSDILKADPSHPATVEYLEGILSEGGSIEGPTALLEAAYESTSDWKKYIDILESQARQSRVMARRLELLAKIAEVQEQKMNLKTLAFNTYVRMFHEDLTNERVRSELERIAAEDENLEALAAVYEEELDNVEEPAIGVAIALKVAQIQEQELLDDDEAIRFYRIVLRFDTRSLDALKALDRLYEKHERTDDLMDVLSKEVELLEDPQDQVRILYRLGTGLYERLEQPAKAVGYFRKVLELDPEHVDSMKMLERAFAELGDPGSLYGILLTRLERTQELVDRTELVARIADLAADQLGKPDEAIDLWNNVLLEDERNQDAFDALDRLYETTERWLELAGIVETRMQSIVDPEKIAALSSRLAWVKGEKLGELEDAMTHWREVLKLDPKNAEALQALRGIYTTGGMWDELPPVLRKLVPLQEDMVGVKAIRFELAEILGEKLDRRDEAIDAAKRALDIEPHTSKDLDRMAAIFQANEAWQDAVTVLEQGVDLKEADAEKIDALLEVAFTWKDKIGRPLGAASAYQKILEIDPIHDEAFRAVEVVYREHKEWRRLTTLLEGRLVHIREKKDRVVLIGEIAEIYEIHLGQKELAFARYCAAFREDFADDTVLAKLESLAEDTEDYDTLLEVIEDAADEVGSGPRAVSLYSKIAGIYRTRLGQTEEAEKWLQKAVEIDKRDVSSLDSLSELYQDQDRWGDLIKVLETKYERSDDLDERKDIRARIALLQEERLDRVDLSIESFRRILELDGRDARAIQSLIRLYQREERWHELIQILRRAAEQAEEREVATGHIFNIAGIYETELNSDEDAIDAYRSVIEEDPTHAESLKALERIYTRLDRWSELLQVFEEEVVIIEDSREKIKLYNKMGSIWEERFGNVESAAACHDGILELDAKSLQSVKALERLVRRMGDFKRLIELYYQHIDLVEDRQEIVDIHLNIGDVWYRELSRVDKAEDVYAAALKIDEQSRQAIHALGQLYEKSGNWFNAIEMLQKEAELCGATPEAVDLYYRMGKINEDMLLDAGAARGSYGKALSIDPSYLPAIKALKLIHYLDKEYDQYLEMMIQEAEHTEDVEEKTRLFYEIGKFQQEQRDDSSEAAKYYEEAMRRTPDFLPAAKPLADIYFRTEQWEEAEKMMEIVVAGLDRNTEAKELCRQYYRLGYITEKLGKGERALEHYRESYDLDATYLPALEGLGNALIKTEQWDEAYRIYQTILIHHRDSLSDAEVAELYWQIGDVNFHMGEIDRSAGSFKKALEIDDTHLASLQYLVRIYEEQEDWEEAYDHGMRMVDAMDEEDLFAHYVRLGVLCREKIQDPFRAVDSLQGALKLRPDSLEVMNGLLEVYVETSQQQKAVDILDRIVAVESRPHRLVGYHEQAGGLLRDKLHDDVRAVEHFNAALDIDPSYVQAFQAITEILSQRKDWLVLKDNYINMIRRLPVGAPKTKLALWKDLGELCRVVLRNLNESIDAYKMITTLDPSDVDSLATLGDLLAAKPGAAGEAISTHHKVLSMSADRVKSYRTLWKLYNQKKEYDKVYSVATILRYLKKADDEEQKIVNYFSRKAPQVASRPVGDKVWESMLAHSGVKVPFTRIFSLLYRKAMPMFVKEHKELNLRRRDHLVDLARDRSLFAHNFRIAAKILGGMEVELFALKEEDAPQPPGLEIVPTKPTALVAYRDLFREDKKKHLLFQIGRQLALARPEFILNWFLKVKDMEDLLNAACQLVDPNFSPQTGDPRAVETVRNRLKRAINDAGLGMLKRAVVDYLENPRAFNLRRWVEAVEHSVNRAGLIVCNDLSVTLGILKKESGWLTPMRPIQKVREMLVFASSPDYLMLREAIGLAVTQ